MISMKVSDVLHQSSNGQKYLHVRTQMVRTRVWYVLARGTTSERHLSVQSLSISYAAGMIQATRSEESQTKSLPMVYQWQTKTSVAGQSPYTTVLPFIHKVVSWGCLRETSASSRRFRKRQYELPRTSNINLSSGVPRLS